MGSDTLQHMSASSDANLDNVASGLSVDGPLPFDNAKNNLTGTVRFVNEVSQRSTITLLISCCITLGLCAYSIVRFNIPPKGERKCGNWFKWWIFALFAPEVVLYTALRQLVAAWQLCEEVRKPKESTGPRSILKKTTPKSKEDNASWTLANGFYATMGGFAVDLDYAEGRQSRLFGDVKRLTLTSKGVALLAQCGHLPDIPVSEIKEKSQMGGVAKLLVCVQAGWMVVQVITRAVVSLPISLLELYTVAQAAVTLIIYMIWWYKPRYVVAPTLLRSEKIQSLVMYMYLASQMSGDQPRGRLARFQTPQPELQRLAYVEAEDQGSVQDEIRSTLHRLETGFDIAPGRFIPQPWSSSSRRRREPLSPMPEDDIKLEQRRLAAEAVSTYPALRSRFTLPKDLSQSKVANSFTPYTSELVQSHITNWPNHGLLGRPQSHLAGLVLCGAVMGYGAIHVTPWHNFFPTEIEKSFWVLGSAWVTFCAFLGLLANLLAQLVPFVNRIWVAYDKGKVGSLGTGVITVLCVLCSTSYIVSRAFLVVETFVSFREMPRGMYRTPAWIQAFPHL